MAMCNKSSWTRCHLHFACPLLLYEGFQDQKAKGGATGVVLALGTGCADHAHGGVQGVVCEVVEELKFCILIVKWRDKIV